MKPLEFILRIFANRKQIRGDDKILDLRFAGPLIEPLSSMLQFKLILMLSVKMVDYAHLLFFVNLD